MTDEQALKLINERLKVFTFHRFSEVAYQKKYVQSLLKQNYGMMCKAADIAYEKDGRNSPEISALIGIAESLKTHDDSNHYTKIQNDEYCAVCDNRGWVSMVERRENKKDQFYDYSYFPYCPYCKVGQAFAIKGESPITKYLDDIAIAALKRENIEKHEVNSERQAIRFESILANMGRKMPEVKAS